MKTRKEPCGCIVEIDRRGNERLPRPNMCATDRLIAETRHQASVESCSEAYRARRNSPLSTEETST